MDSCYYKNCNEELCVSRSITKQNKTTKPTTSDPKVEIGNTLFEYGSQQEVNVYCMLGLSVSNYLLGWNQDGQKSSYHGCMTLRIECQLVAEPSKTLIFDS